MINHIETGQVGENLACNFLKKQGYKIIETNVRQPWGELDIVCQDVDKTLVFVEVKTLNIPLDNNSQYPTQLMPEDEMSKSKYLKTAKMANTYANTSQHLIREDRGWRIDLVAIEIKGNRQNIKHYKNIFV